MNFEVRQKPTFFPGNNNPFSTKATVVWIKISEKGGSVFLVLNLFTFFKKGKIMVPKYQPGWSAYLNKLQPGII